MLCHRQNIIFLLDTKSKHVFSQLSCYLRLTTMEENCLKMLVILDYKLSINGYFDIISKKLCKDFTFLNRCIA